MKHVFKFKYVMLMGLLSAISLSMSAIIARDAGKYQARLSCHTKENWQNSSEDNIKPGTIISFPGQDWSKASIENDIKYANEDSGKFDLKLLDLDGYWWFERPEDEVFAEARNFCKLVGMPYPILFKEGDSSWISGARSYTLFKKVPVE